MHVQFSSKLSIAIANMNVLTDVTNTLENTRPPNELLCKYENHYIPIYSIQAFQDLNRPFHMGVIMINN